MYKQAKCVKLGLISDVYFYNKKKIKLMIQTHLTLCNFNETEFQTTFYYLHMCTYSSSVMTVQT